MTSWVNRIVLWLSRLNFWRVMALLAALVLLVFTLLGPSAPSLINIRRL